MGRGERTDAIARRRTPADVGVVTAEGVDRYWREKSTCALLPLQAAKRRTAAARKKPDAERMATKVFYP